MSAIDPEETVLYRTREPHRDPLARASGQGGGRGLPAFVTRERRATCAAADWHTLGGPDDAGVPR